MLQCCPSRNALVGVVHEKRRQEVDTDGLKVRQELGPMLRFVLREVGLPIRELDYGWPRLLTGSAQHLEDLLQLVRLVVARKERPAGDHLGENAADAPDVNR